MLGDPLVDLRLKVGRGLDRVEISPRRDSVGPSTVVVTERPADLGEAQPGVGREAWPRREGQNHLLAVLLEAGLDPGVAPLPKITVRMSGTEANHELVRLDGPTLAQPIYVDAWSNLPPSTLDPTQPGAAPSLTSLGSSPPKVVPGAAGRAPFDARIYAEGDVLAIPPLSPRKAPTKPVDLDLRAPALDPASLTREQNPWKLYLYARILHVFDDPRAAELYRMVIERECGKRKGPRPFRCAASTLLLQRLDQIRRL